MENVAIYRKVNCYRRAIKHKLFKIKVKYSEHIFSYVRIDFFKFWVMCITFHFCKFMKLLKIVYFPFFNKKNMNYIKCSICVSSMNYQENGCILNPFMGLESLLRKC